jgi:hypothetical protein
VGQAARRRRLDDGHSRERDDLASNPETVAFDELHIPGIRALAAPKTASITIRNQAAFGQLLLTSAMEIMS